MKRSIYAGALLVVSALSAGAFADAGAQFAEAGRSVNVGQGTFVMPALPSSQQPAALTGRVESRQANPVAGRWIQVGQARVLVPANR